MRRLLPKKARATEARVQIHRRVEETTLGLPENALRCNKVNGLKLIQKKAPQNGGLFRDRFRLQD